MHKEELDQVHQEMAVHKEELIKVQQDLAIAATTVLDLQNRLKAATCTPEAVSEVAERRLMQKLIDIEQKVTNVGKSWDIKAAVCPETHVHTAFTTSDTFAESCELSIPTEDATVDVNDFRSLMNVPGIDGHSNPKPHHLEDGAEIARAQQTAHGQVAFENANLLLSAECRTETLASTTRLQRQSIRAYFSHSKFKQEDCDWTNHDCKKVMKIVGYQTMQKGALVARQLCFRQLAQGYSLQQRLSPELELSVALHSKPCCLGFQWQGLQQEGNWPHDVSNDWPACITFGQP